MTKREAVEETVMMIVNFDLSAVKKKCFKNATSALSSFSFFCLQLDTSGNSRSHRAYMHMTCIVRISDSYTDFPAHDYAHSTKILFQRELLTGEILPKIKCG